MDLTHPVMHQMINLGCSSQLRITLAFQTFIDLCEVFVLRNVDYHFNKKLDIIYISTKEESGQTIYYIPVNVSESFSPKQLREWCLELTKEDPSIDVYLVIRDIDTTETFYKISPGLATPLSLEAAQMKKGKEENLDYIRSVIIKRRHSLYNEAKYSQEKNETSTKIKL